MRVGEDELRRQDSTQIQPPQGRRHTVDLPQVRRVIHESKVVLFLV